MRVRCLLSVGCVWAGEQSLLVLLPHDEHLQRQRRRGEKRRLRADKRLTSERERQCGNACLCIRLHSYRKSCQNRPAAETHTGLHIEGLGQKMSLLQSTSGKHAYTRTRQHTCRENSFMSVFFRVVGVFRSESRSLLLRQRLSCSDLTECTRENRWSRVKFRVRNPLSNMIKDLIPPEIGWCCLSTLSVSRNNCRVLGR